MFSVPIFGLDIPGYVNQFPLPGLPGGSYALHRIFKLGPTFNVDVEGIANIEAELNMTVGLAYNVNNGRLTFPPDQGASSGSFAPADNSESHMLDTRQSSSQTKTDLQLLASPDASGQASVEAHVIPNVRAVHLNVGLHINVSCTARVWYRCAGRIG